MERQCPLQGQVTGSQPAASPKILGNRSLEGTRQAHRGGLGGRRPALLRPRSRQETGRRHHRAGCAHIALGPGNPDRPGHTEVRRQAAT